MISELGQLAFEHMAYLYPAEIHALKPEEFWIYFQRVCPGVSREQMGTLLEKTAQDPVDICDKCGEEFGDLCLDDANGYNCTCQHCGNNTYTTRSLPTTP